MHLAFEYFNNFLISSLNSAVTNCPTLTMGLAEPRTKQRIGVDPQNKQWKDDSNKLCLKMMEKMGWSEGKGLGRNEDGRTDNIKVVVKSNNHGIGTEKRSSDNWLENSSAFDALLSSLGSTNETTDQQQTTKVDETLIAVELKSAALPQFGRLYHRKKFIRNKQVSNYDAANLSEILGQKPTKKLPLISCHSDSKISSDVATKQVPCHLVDAIETVTVSNLSVQEYFAQRMALLKQAALTKTTTEHPSFKRKHDDDEDKNDQQSKLDDDSVKAEPNSDSVESNDDIADSSAAKKSKKESKTKKKSKNKKESKSKKHESKNKKARKLKD
ncbi:Golgi transport complex subunit 3 [Batrachochytrium dendrobatidis]|nr:Golgi transport complex subunit 3 [Batrachochytrium dendrobatidis]